MTKTAIHCGIEPLVAACSKCAGFSVSETLPVLGIGPSMIAPIDNTGTPELLKHMENESENPDVLALVEDAKTIAPHLEFLGHAVGICVSPEFQERDILFTNGRKIRHGDLITFKARGEVMRRCKLYVGLLPAMPARRVLFGDHPGPFLGTWAWEPHLAIMTAPVTDLVELRAVTHFVRDGKLYQTDPDALWKSHVRNGPPILRTFFPARHNEIVPTPTKEIAA